MTLTFRDKEGTTRVVDTEYVEIEGMTTGEIKNNRWIFKDYKAAEKIEWWKDQKETR